MYEDNMLNGLSILIPCYNGLCSGLVEALRGQAEGISDARKGKFTYEILVGDDGSTDVSVLESNRKINELSNCRYIERGKNCGRSAIRNFLAKAAQHEWLLFIDCHMAVRNDDYLRNYVVGERGDVVYGGYEVNGDKESLRGNLRYLYECTYDPNANAQERMKRPYNDFHTSNFLVRRDLMLRYPLDERIKRYGYEDVLWGKALQTNGISIAHIDNPLSFEKFEPNADFVAKTEEGVRTLADFQTELEGYSRLLQVVQRLRGMHLIPLIASCHKAFCRRVRRNLIGDHPNVRLFSLYKLGLFCSLVQQ